MKVSVNNLSRIANDYIMQVIVPKMPNNYMKFGLAFAANYVGSSFVNQQLAKYQNIIKTFGIIDENNCIDIDLFRDNALKALKTCDGSRFAIYNYTVDEEDINSLYLIAKNYVEPTLTNNFTSTLTPSITTN